MDFDATRATLLMRVKNRKDQQSWDEFVHYYKPYIYRVIKNAISGHHDCEDLVQKTLVTCWEKLPEYEYDPERSKFRTWICTIARNYVLKFYRDTGRYNNKIDNFGENSPDTLSEPEIEKLAEKEWQLYISNMAWENIKSQFDGKALECFMMMSDGLSAAIVAEKLGLTVGSVYVLKKRVTEKLYREINRLDQDLN